MRSLWEEIGKPYVMSKLAKNYRDNLSVGDVVSVEPNLRSIFPGDHAEKVWNGIVEYITERSVGVSPIDKKPGSGYGRDVHKERVGPRV